MKSTTLFCFILFVNFGFSQTNSTDANSKIAFEKNNYKIQYPKTWRIDTSKTLGADFFAFSPSENKDDKFSENVNIMIQDLGGQKVSLEQYKQVTEKQMVALMNDAKIIESAVIKTGNKEYYKVLFTMTQGTFKLKTTAICFIKKGKAYLATFSAEAAKYEQYKKITDEILSSFSLTN